MKLEALAVVALLASACGKDAPTKPNDPPKLSAAGDVVVPDGHETTYSYDGTDVKLEWTWADITYVEGKPALGIHAQDRERPASFAMSAAIPAGTANLAQMAGTTVGAIPWTVQFGNAPEMASGDGATIQITEVTPAYIAGTFDAQSCKHGERPCKDPKQVKKGAFKAFRSALSDDATFTRYTTGTPPSGY